MKIMGDYIKREDAKVNLCNKVEKKANHNQGVYLYSDEFCGVIDAIPAADVEPVRYGKWIWTEDGCVCTCCNKMTYEEFNYCPNCGAKMDGDKE